MCAISFRKGSLRATPLFGESEKTANQKGRNSSFPETCKHYRDVGYYITFKIVNTLLIKSNKTLRRY
jgi:hypothetical protein